MSPAMMTNTTDIALKRNPFPGLRPFQETEEHLFFGRENQVDAMVDKLAATRFLAVVGPSGSGKSSLVNCGLRPALHRGFMATAGTAWRIAQFRPGNDPIAAMARALAVDGVLFQNFKAAGLSLTEIIDTTLRMSKLGVLDIYEQARLDPDVNLLVVVDQFEELFRYHKIGAQEAAHHANEAAIAFVNLLLEASRQRAFPIYIVLTMRSDFLGDCAQFPGLPEASNAGQFLVPRLTRAERRTAISGPVRVSGAEISPVLLTRLVNDVGDNPDQLSILQHALNRTWARWHDRGGEGLLELSHYQAIGTMAHALDQHAERAYAELKCDRKRQICQTLFQAITDTATDTRGIRRPTTLKTLCALTEATAAEVTDVIDIFREPSRSFLMPPAGEPLTTETVIDISHESLMRVWQRLKDWAAAEAQSAQIYQRLADTAALHQDDKASLLRDPELTVSVRWRDQNHPNAAWAQRYNPAFSQAMQFLEASVTARDAERSAQDAARSREVNQLRAFSMTLASLLVVAGVATTLAFRARADSAHRKDNAEILAHSLETKDFFKSHLQLDALIKGIRLGQQVKHLGPKIEPGRQMQATTELHNVVTRIQERNRLEGHTGGITKVSFSPDGQTIVSGSADGTVKLWDHRGALLHTLAVATQETADSWVYSVSFSPDSQRILVSNSHCALQVWNRQGQLLQKLIEPQQCDRTPKKSPIVSTFSPDGETIVSGHAEGIIQFWNRQGHVQHSVPAHTQRIVQVRFSPDGQTLASASLDGTVKLWSRTGQPLSTLQGHEHPVLSIAFSPDSQNLVSAGAKGVIKLWTRHGELLHTQSAHDGRIGDVQFNPNGTILASASVDDGTVKLWARQGELLETITGQGSGATGMSFSPNGDVLALGSIDRTVRLWHYQREPAQILRAHQAGVWGVQYSADGTRMASGDADGVIKLWDRQGQVLRSWVGHGDMVWSVRISPDGQMIASASRDRTVKLWNREGQLLQTLTGHTDSILGVSFSPDGQIIASASDDDTVKLWNREGKLLHTLDGHTDNVISVGFSPDGQRIVSGSVDKTIKVWNVQGQLLQTLEGHQNEVWDISFSPDGQLIASASGDRTIKLWTREGKPLQTLRGHSVKVFRVSFNPADGQTLASASGDGTIKFWDLDGNLLQSLQGHGKRVLDLSFRPDGQTLVSASSDGSLKQWNFQLDHLLAQGCRWLAPYLHSNANVRASDHQLCEEID